MMRTLLLTALLGCAPLAFTVPAQGAGESEGPVYQLRTYFTAPGKLPVLLERFERHNLPIFERHGITLVGAWTPLDPGEADRLVYLVRFPGREAAERAWTAFRDDPEWKRVFDAEKQAHGQVVARVQTIYLAPTDYSPDPGSEIVKSSGAGRVYALRTYLAAPGKLDALNARFRDHTVELFRKHGMTSLLYTTPIEPDQGADTTLIYFLSFPDRTAAEASWTGFRNDPEWQRIKARTEEQGSLTQKVEQLDLKPTAFSPLK